MSSIAGRFKQWIFAFGHYNEEEPKLVEFVERLQLKPDQKLLDVGCGYGSKLKLLGNRGFQVLGVEVNPEIVKANRNQGLNCMTLDEFSSVNEKFDVLLFSHVVEHFSPAALLELLEHYLDRLKIGGHIIIITPLMTQRFYNDFDHVKPYYPTGIQMVFGKENAQVQYYSRNKLEIEDLWFRRSPWQMNLARGIYVSRHSPIPNYVNLLLRILCRLTLGFCSQRDAWMGIYRKVS